MKTIETDLLIGGPKDGSRIRVLYGDMAIMDLTPSARYNRTRMAAGDTIFVFWLFQGMTDEEGFERLFLGYRPGNGLQAEA